jgi:dTDP-4-amino-4,6-dideoxygalactose transaminase
MTGLIAKVIRMIRAVTMPYQFGFVRGHSYLEEQQLKLIKQTLEANDAAENKRIIDTYEAMFARTVGEGAGISFASGRMAFYTLMKVLGIGDGDEVILPAFTCAVMPNAVMKTGARPVYAEIDSNTFGSDSHGIAKVISKRTKLIVAQHSFGIPCNIHEIIELARRHGIYVVEDCAISFDSSLQGTKVGNWGDAAIFSTDHSKPLNTLIGGLLYTNNHELYQKVRAFTAGLPCLSSDHQYRLYDQVVFERSKYTPDRYPRTQLFNVLRSKLRNLYGTSEPIFLEDDFTATKKESTSYPYPATLPPFLAQLGIFELERWPDEKVRRKLLLSRLVEIFSQSPYVDVLPSIYSDPDRDIIPLRFIFTCSDKGYLRLLLAQIIDTNWIWFQQPIIGAVNGLESMGYSKGSCPVSEDICSTIINMPCVVDETWAQVLCHRLEEILRTGIKGT